MSEMPWKYRCHVSRQFFPKAKVNVYASAEGPFGILRATPMAVRMKDIADDLNVSVVTVSKVLRNEGDISAATRERVLKRAGELNYQPNWVARSLVTRRTYIIGLVVPDLMHSFFAEVAKGVTSRVRPAGYSVVIANSEEDPELEAREVELLMARQVDGLLIASCQPQSNTSIFKRINELKVPYVLMDRDFDSLDANYVGVRNEDLGFAATKHLIEQGFKRIAHIRGPQLTTGVGRWRGYAAALQQQGLKVPARYVVEGESDDVSGYAAMKKLLALEPQPDAVFCFNDPVAMGAIRAIKEAGLRIPGDIAIVGAGNVRYSDLLQVPLSTLDQGSSLMGQHAADLLLELIGAKRTPKPKRVLMTPRLINRESSMRLPG
jgi:LacI family transcriptional regulator